MLRKDLQELRLYRPVIKTDDEGSLYSEYAGCCGMFFGNVQPAGAHNSLESYGLDTRYNYVVYTESLEMFRELDRIGADTSANLPLMEIKAIQKWRGITKLLCEAVGEGL